MRCGRRGGEREGPRPRGPGAADGTGAFWHSILASVKRPTLRAKSPDGQLSALAAAGRSLG